MVLLALLLHLFFISTFGAHSPPAIRQPTNAPQWHLAGDHEEILRLINPALFALPNPDDFASTLWNVIPRPVEPRFRWSEPPRWLEWNPAQTSAQTIPEPRPVSHANVFPEIMPATSIPEPPLLLGESMPDHSYMVLLGNLAARGLRYPLALPSLTNSDLTPPSRVQVLVNPSGSVVSALLLPPSDSSENIETYPLADQQAVIIARQLQFHPAPHAELGEMDFYWHILPAQPASQ